MSTVGIRFVAALVASAVLVLSLPTYSLALCADKRNGIASRGAPTNHVFVGVPKLDGFTPPTVFDVGVAPSGWSIVGSGDFDGDGVGDLLWRHTPSGDVSIWLLQGNSAGVSLKKAQTVFSGLGARWQTVGIGDFDGDSYGDILWYDSVSHGVYVWLMQGLGPKPLSGYVTTKAGTMKVASVGDYDGDGYPDIAWVDPAPTSPLSIWTMVGRTVTGAYVGGGFTSKVLGSGDVSGDGHADLFVLNPESSQVEAW